MAKPPASIQQDSPSAEAPLLTNEPLQDELAPSTPLSVLILYFMAIHFLLAFCEIILVAPLIKLIENSLCLSHYGFPGNGVREELCKIPEIQGPLATIRGWQSTFNTIPGIICLCEEFDTIVSYLEFSSVCCYPVWETGRSFWEEEDISCCPRWRCWFTMRDFLSVYVIHLCC